MPFYSMNNRDIPDIRYIYVFRSNNTNTVRKYDLDGNLILTLSSANYNATTIRVAVRSLTGDMYYAPRNASGSTTSRILKPDLTSLTQTFTNNTTDVAVSRESVYLVGDDKMFLRTFLYVSAATSYTNLDWNAALKNIHVDPYDNYVFVSVNGVGIYALNKSNTSISLLSSDTLRTGNYTPWTHPQKPSNVYFSTNSEGTIRAQKNNVASATALNNATFGSGLPVVVLSNGNVVFIQLSNIRCRTIANIDANSATNVWSVTLSTPLCIRKDSNDNIYAINASTVRKYDKNGVVVWSITGQTVLNWLVDNPF